MKNWSEKLTENYDVLKDFILAYHPASYQKNNWSPPITAQGAEKACETIRDKISKESPVINEQYVDSVREDNETMYQLLQAAWFGVPESTACWDIPGFALAVDLLEEYDEIH